MHYTHTALQRRTLGLVLTPNSVTCFQNMMREIPANHNLISLIPKFSIFLTLVRDACHTIPRKIHSNLDNESEIIYDSPLGSIPGKKLFRLYSKQSRILMNICWFLSGLAFYPGAIIYICIFLCTASVSLFRNLTLGISICPKLVYINLIPTTKLS